MAMDFAESVALTILILFYPLPTSMLCFGLTISTIALDLNSLLPALVMIPAIRAPVHEESMACVHVCVCVIILNIKCKIIHKARIFLKSVFIIM